MHLSLNGRPAMKKIGPISLEKCSLATNGCQLSAV
jgi:hypothetical protein